MTTESEGDKALLRIRKTLGKTSVEEEGQLRLTEEQDAVLELRNLQTTLEKYRDNKYPDDSVVEEMERPRVDERLKLLSLSNRAGSDPLGWLASIDRARVLQRRKSGRI